jgi:hypothetical protein
MLRFPSQLSVLSRLIAGYVIRLISSIRMKSTESRGKIGHYRSSGSINASNQRFPLKTVHPSLVLRAEIRLPASVEKSVTRDGID